MRINRGPGGPNRTSGAQGTQKTGATGKSAFGGMVGSTAANGTEEANRAQSALVAELAELAAELEAGRASKEEASRRFVKIVLKRKFGQQKGKGAEKMEETVSDMVEADPQFVSKLQSQLKRIAKG